jgi:hypothetical protein
MTAVAEPSVLVEPAFVWRPPRHHSLLPKVEKVCKMLGETIEPEQALAIDVLTGRKVDGSPAARSAAVICARQNLKTYILERIVLTMLLDPQSDMRLVVWTAQELNTTEETFDHFASWFDSGEYPLLSKRCAKVGHGRGSYEIRLHSGRRIKFKARGKRSGQGLTGDAVVFDEAFALESAHMSALVPTLSTRRRAAIFYGSSACHEESEVLHGIVERGRKGGSGAPAYVEWCAPGSLKNPGCEMAQCRHTVDMVGCSLDRLDYVQMANPLAGRDRADGGLPWENLLAERQEMPPGKYARERLGWHDALLIAAVPPVTVEMWRKQTDPESSISDEKPLVFAAEIATDRKSASIAVAGHRVDGAQHVELIEQDNGTDWLLPRLLELADHHSLYEIERRGKKCRAIVLDPMSPAGDLVDPLRRENIEPVIMTSREVAAACGGLQDALAEQTVWHLESSTIDVALKGAVRRDLGDGGWAFGRKKSAAESVDITPLVAVTNARWGLTVVEQEPDPDIAGFY